VAKESLLLLLLRAWCSGAIQASNRLWMLAEGVLQTEIPEQKTKLHRKTFKHHH
jgi:hypothetical protein